MKTDIEIAQECKMQHISEVAKSIGLDAQSLELYGNFKAKVVNARGNKRGKLILVTAISPTPAGEGKTTTTVGLGDGLRKIGKNAMIALREPSLGPVFGVKGGAAGGGYAQVVPMEDINLHFTGDFHAITSANNLLAALLDNHIQQGNALNIDVRKISWRRCLDMNDRQLRNIVNGLGGKANGTPREDGFDITVASEVMAALCLAQDISDLKERLGSIIVAYSYEDKPIYARDLQANGAMAALLKDAIKPNLVQTLEGTPAFVHGGPFANIAHGCNSVIATKTALSLCDYVVTEAGFGADLGAEKFLDIKCRLAGLKPDAVVIVATVRALKYHGGQKLADLKNENISALKSGMQNLQRHIGNIKNIFGLNCVVAINKFPCDTEQEIACLMQECKAMGAQAYLSDVYAKGGEGARELSEAVVEIANKPCNFSFAYDLNLPIAKKIEQLAKNVYGGLGIKIDSSAQSQIKKLEKMGFGALPICIAKTQYSFSDNAKLLGAPTDFYLNVKNVRVSCGAGFVVVLCGDIMTMPGLPKEPAACNIDVDSEGKISGLF